MELEALRNGSAWCPGEAQGDLGLGGSRYIAWNPSSFPLIANPHVKCSPRPQKLGQAMTAFGLIWFGGSRKRLEKGEQLWSLPWEEHPGVRRMLPSLCPFPECRGDHWCW